MGKLFGGGDDRPRAAPIKAPPTVDVEGARAAERQRRKRRKGRGRASTILSGALGDTSGASIGSKGLTGA